MAASSLLPSCLRSAALFLIILCYYPTLISSLIVVRPTIQQRSNAQLTPRRPLCVAATNKDALEDPIKQVETLVKPKKKTTKTKVSVAAKVKGAVPKKNGAKTESDAAAKKKKRKRQPEGPAYWKNETDHVSLLDRNLTITDSTSNVHMVQFKVRGSPRPLRRHRTSRGFMYNPSSKYQASFREVVQETVWNNKEEPIFGEEDHLAMRLVFYMKRPKLHFVGGKPGPGRLRPIARGRLAPTRTDVDNLAKFVLDSLNGLLYVDDRQVASIHATKLYDNDGTCDGCIKVSIQRLYEEDVDDLLR